MGTFPRGSRRRFLSDAVIAVGSLVAVVTLIAAIDAGTGGQVAQMLDGGANARVAVQVRDDTMLLARSAWDLTRLYTPLTSFVCAAIVLLVVMMRTR